jgi:hypothetical protein
VWLQQSTHCWCDRLRSINGWRDGVVTTLQLNASRSAAKGSQLEHVPNVCTMPDSSGRMVSPADSVSQPTLVSGPQAMRRMASESSDKARYSRVHAIRSYALKHMAPRPAPRRAGRSAARATRLPRGRAPRRAASRSAPRGLRAAAAAGRDARRPCPAFTDAFGARPCSDRARPGYDSHRARYDSDWTWHDSDRGRY